MNRKVPLSCLWPATTRTNSVLANTVIVFDFETTGLSPDQGDQPIEIGAVKLQGGKVVDRFQSLMRPSKRIPRFIEDLTGISNAMVAAAESCDSVMADFADFAEGFPLVAHNIGFDRRFLHDAYMKIGREPTPYLACTLLISRRLFPSAPDHKLATLVAMRHLPADGTYHRALADAEMTSHLWCDLACQVAEVTGHKPIPFDLMTRLGKTPIKNAPNWLQKQRCATT